MIAGLLGPLSFLRCAWNPNLEVREVTPSHTEKSPLGHEKSRETRLWLGASAIIEGLLATMDGSVTWGHVTQGPFPGAVASLLAGEEPRSPSSQLLQAVPRQRPLQHAEETLRTLYCHLGWGAFLL